MTLIELEPQEAFAAYNTEEAGIKRGEYICIFRANTLLRKHSFSGNVH